MSKSTDDSYKKFLTYIPKDLLKKVKVRAIDEDKELSELVEELLQQWIGSVDSDLDQEEQFVPAVQMALHNGAVMNHSEKDVHEKSLDGFKEDHPEACIHHCFSPKYLDPKEFNGSLSIVLVGKASIAELTEHGLAWHREFIELGREKFVERYWSLENYTLHTPDPNKGVEPLPEYVAVDWGAVAKGAA